MYLFNVHVHGASRKSYMFHLLEGIAKMGASTVCSFLWHVVQKKFRSKRHKQIILFSDTCGGQNRNYAAFSFSAALARTLGVSVYHIFSVRRHSYSVCDKNFGSFARKMKKERALRPLAAT